MRAGPPEPFSVSSLTEELRGVLSTTWEDIRVRGEVSQPRRAPSGHVYLTLKDEGAVLPAVIWRSTAARLPMRVEEGLEVVARGGLDVYPPHGRYQFIVRALEPVGEGALRRRIEALRQKLAAEGLFDEDRKRPLPLLPRRIALVTSKTGAAVRDMVTVIRRRLPAVDLLLVPVRVQGFEAPGEIREGLARADRLGVDLILVGRGGGALEDLMAFNDEGVVRQIAASVTPVISAVGHETDITLADLAADVRAATPSQAGELAVPVRAELLERLDREQERLTTLLRRTLDRGWQRTEALAERPVLASPSRLLRSFRHTLALARERLEAQRPHAALARRRDQVEALGSRLARNLRRQVQSRRQAIERTDESLARGLKAAAGRARTRLDGAAGRLEALSPLAVLRRGYSLTEAVGPDGARVLSDAGTVHPGETIRTRLAAGAILSEVREIERGDEAAEGDAP